MALTEAQKAAKARYAKKKYDEAPMVECACGCGTMMKSADEHGRDKAYLNGHNNRKYSHDDKWASRKRWLRDNRDWVNNRRQKLQRERKQELIKHMGGVCSDCGLLYNGTNAAVFDFHHDEPWEKEFGVGGKLSDKPLAVLKAEVEKCRLLCANCHRIHHLGEC